MFGLWHTHERWRTAKWKNKNCNFSNQLWLTLVPWPKMSWEILWVQYLWSVITRQCDMKSIRSCMAMSFCCLWCIAIYCYSENEWKRVMIHVVFIHAAFIYEKTEKKNVRRWGFMHFHNLCTETVIAHWSSSNPRCPFHSLSRYLFSPSELIELNQLGIARIPRREERHIRCEQMIGDPRATGEPHTINKGNQ